MIVEGRGTAFVVHVGVGSGAIRDYFESSPVAGLCYYGYDCVPRFASVRKGGEAVGVQFQDCLCTPRTQSLRKR